MTSTLNFTSALRMKVDINKSWGWGTSKDMRQFWQSTESLFLHDQSAIAIKHASKDLGCMLQYTKKVVLGCLKDRMLSASRRLGRLSKQQIPLREKASKIQSAIWPLAFYGAESQFIGETHFAKLRRQASDVLVGPHKYASSYLALHMLCDRVEDPLLYVIATALCSFRRLFHYHPHLMQEIWDCVCSDSIGYGPCGALSQYLAKVQWIPKPGGVVQMPSGHQIFLRIQSTKEIRIQLRQAWSFYVFQQVQHRKGVTLQSFDSYTQHKVLRTVSDATLRLIALNLTGGFQTGATKAIWDASASDKCAFCGEVDTHEHRLLFCPDFKHVRDNHPSAIQTLTAHPNLLWLPLATSHAQQIVYNRLKLRRQGPFLDQPFVEPQTHCIFYTDGTCDKPREQNCCRAAWAVVQHVRHSSTDPSVGDFIVTQTSHTRGFQSINRGELEAVTWLAHYFHHHQPHRFMSVFSDSSFVVKIVNAISNGLLSTKVHHLARADLIQTLSSVWDPLYHSIFKVKSHRCKEEAVDVDDLSTILGNDFADHVAKEVNKRDLPALLDAACTISQHSQRQIEALFEAYLYLAELNSLHAQLKLQKEHPSQTQGSNNSVDAFANFQNILGTWSVGEPSWIFNQELPEVVGQACPSGAHIAFRAWYFFDS